ncbi:MAG: hypothetical protein PHY12_16240, partial [Eubacteriales bacterium]|nr:hypothetical protein [Eubacteriales bacterium]
AYEEAREAVDGYLQTLNVLHSCLSALRYAAQAAQDREDRIAQARDEADDIRRMRDAQAQRVAQTQACIREIEQFLELPENRDRARRMAELERDKEEHGRVERAARERCVGLEGDIRHTREDRDRCKEELEAASELATAAEQYFAEELALGFTMSREERALLECARLAQGKASAADRGRTAERMGEALRNNYLQHNNTLLKYSPQMALTFEESAHAGLLRERQLITLKKDGRE